MEGRVRRIARQRVSHFVLGEEGKVGSRSAFVAATVVGVTSLATMLLGVTQNAQAAGSICRNGIPCPDGAPICCFYQGPPNDYICRPAWDLPPQPPWICW